MSGNQLSYIVVPTLYNHHFSSYARGFVVSPCSPWTLPAWGTWRHDPWWQRNSTRAAAWGRTSRSRRGCRLDRPGSAWWVGWGLGQRFGATPSHQVTSFLMVTIWSCWRYPVFRQTYLLWTKCYMDTGFWPIASRGLSWMNLQRLKPVFFSVMTGQTSWWNHNYLGINLAVESLSSSENMNSFMGQSAKARRQGSKLKHTARYTDIKRTENQLAKYVAISSTILAGQVKSVSSLNPFHCILLLGFGHSASVVTNDLSDISEDIPWFSTCSSGVRPPQWLPHNVVCAQVSRAHPAERLRDAQRLSHHPGHHIAGESTKRHRDLHLTWRGFAFWGGERVEIEFGDIYIYI